MVDQGGSVPLQHLTGRVCPSLPSRIQPPQPW